MPTVHTVSAIVFYDQDDDGRLGPGEPARLGNVTVEAGSRNGVSERLSGRATLSVPEGTQTFRIRAETLPAFYVPGAEVVTAVPVMGEIHLPVRLPIGPNRHSVYLATGDSITAGDGSRDRRGYPGLLEDRLVMEYGQGRMINEGMDGGKSNQAAGLIGEYMVRHRPAYVFIMFGTNDWNKCKVVSACFTQDSLASVVRQTRQNFGLPFLATIPPINVGIDPLRAPPQRNEWVEEMNTFVRIIAEEQGAVLVDVHAAFMEEAGGNLASLFVDHVHPNDRGHAILADTFFKAITSPSTVRAEASFFEEARSFESIPAAPGWPPLEVLPIEVEPLRTTPLFRKRFGESLERRER